LCSGPFCEFSRHIWEILERFTPALYRRLGAEWLFPKEKATFDAAVMLTSEVKTL
jgi:hypothetical protein